MENTMLQRAFNTKEFRFELEHNILPFWMNKMIDELNGGFYGRIDYCDQLKAEAPKGSVLNARILWTFSAAFQLIKSKTYLYTATRAFDYIKTHFLDQDHGGLYWMLDAKGNPLETKKQIYAQAFAVYALSEYHKSAPDRGALELAMRLFECIETHSFDSQRNGYFEAYDQNWNMLEDLRLSEKDANEAKTMNTHLHILEAYTTLYEVSQEAQVGQQLRNLINLFFDKFMTSSFQFNLFFDEDWQLKSQEVSYGHDIETAWLVHDGAKMLGDQELIQKCEQMAVKVAEATLPFFDQDGALFYEGNVAGVFNKEKHWWPQAEALVGLVNAFQISGDRKFLTQAEKCWDFIEQHLIDYTNQEWIWGINKSGNVIKEDKAGPWKCPYHNGRAMMELIRRM